jgi:hypothetical protein
LKTQCLTSLIIQSHKHPQSAHMLQEEPHQVTKMVNLPLLSTLMISVILVLGPQPPRSTIQLHPMSPALIKLYLSTLSQCTLVGADLLDTLQTLIQAAQQTKAKVQQSLPPAQICSWNLWTLTKIICCQLEPSPKEIETLATNS